MMNSSQNSFWYELILLNLRFTFTIWETEIKSECSELLQYFSSYCCFLGSEMFGLLLRKVSEPNVRWINLVTTKREKDFLCNEETIIFIIFLLLQLRFSLINFTNLEKAKTGAQVATLEEKERAPVREGQEIHFLPRTPSNTAPYYSWSAYYADNENLATGKLHVQ